jgi:tetraacyldisaccharide 4'-kinase
LSYTHFRKINSILKLLVKHIVFYPFSLLYGVATTLRNWLFDADLLKSTPFSIPIVSIGNLAVGGTGKTPHTEFILTALENEWKIAVLSRGYKRKTKGFVLANEKSDSQTLGDEPFQIHQKFPKVTVAVDEKRVHGVRRLQSLQNDLQLVVLDDAFQHRYIQAGLSILLTDFSNLYSRDLLLPAGTLREWPSGSKRANIIVVTKCPTDISPIDMRVIESELKPENNQSLFFSTFVYKDIIPVFPGSQPEEVSVTHFGEQDMGVLLVAGIVSPEPIVEYLRKYTKHIETLFFEDHHAFQPKDFSQIKARLDATGGTNKILLVTEKDAARLQSNPDFPEGLKSKTYALPIRVEILHNQESLFIQKIKSYVVENSRNR